ncbi:MAG: peptidoglycan editing factor PgeF [Rhizobiales bacterium]|nr:peptidoglycan editing factor PgeF [Hyphomicrobiales bacterium]
MLSAKPLGGLSHIRHGFFTREGGVSKGIYATKNCGYGSDDTHEHVKENRARVAQALSVEPDKLVTVHQTHSADGIIVDAPWAPEEAPKADAMVTATPGIALGILTADCAPVIFADKQARIIGAAHAGWKGALTGILEATLEAMVSLGADHDNIIAAIGPCISRTAYEVGPEFRDRFIDDASQNETFFAPSIREGHFMFDLPSYVETRLHEAGVGAVSVMGQCTYGDQKRFFSYRRATHRKEPDYGRQLSAIMLRPID